MEKSMQILAVLQYFRGLLQPGIERYSYCLSYGFIVCLTSGDKYLSKHFNQTYTQWQNAAIVNPFILFLKRYKSLILKTTKTNVISHGTNHTN